MTKAKKGAGKKAERNPADMFDDATPPNEKDPVFREEMFCLYRDSGMTVEEVGEDDPKEGKLYAKWLKKQETRNNG